MIDPKTSRAVLVFAVMLGLIGLLAIIDAIRWHALANIVNLSELIAGFCLIAVAVIISLVFRKRR